MSLHHFNDVLLQENVVGHHPRGTGMGQHSISNTGHLSISLLKVMQQPILCRCSQIYIGYSAIPTEMLWVAAYRPFRLSPTAFVFQMCGVVPSAVVK